MTTPVRNFATASPAHRFWTVLILGLLGALMLALTLVTIERGDYVRYYRCGELAFLHGDNPYACDGFFQVPPALFFLAPFALLGVPLDAWLWGLTVFVSVFSALVLLLAVFNSLTLRSLSLATALVISPFMLFLIAFQQGSGLVLLLEALAFWCLLQGRYTGAAILVACTVLKPQLTFVLLPLLAPLPRRFQALAAAVAAALLGVFSLPLLGPFLSAIRDVSGSDAGTHSTVELKELFNIVPGNPVSEALSYATMLVPLTYFAYHTFRLWRSGTLDLVVIAKILPAGLLAVPYNRAYDWVLAIPAYLVLWRLYDELWTPGLLINIILAWVALPISTYTFFQNNPISINPLPLLVVILTIEYAQRRHPERAAALNIPLPAPRSVQLAQAL